MHFFFEKKEVSKAKNQTTVFKDYFAKLILKTKPNRVFFFFLFLVWARIMVDFNFRNNIKNNTGTQK